jgi:hypothetical protein
MNRRTPIPRAAFLALLLAACSDVEGTWSQEEPSELGGTARVALELHGGNKAVLSMSAGPGMDMSEEGTYEVDGDTIAVTVLGDTQVFTRKGNTLVGGGLGETLELVKE